MTDGSYILTAIGFVVVSLADRAFLRRRKIHINNVYRDSDNDKYIRFVIDFVVREKLHHAHISYTLRDKKNPATVLVGRSRSIEFSDLGLNSEYLLFNKEHLSHGEWILDLKVVTSGSRINPFYKLFPTNTVIKREFLIK